MIRFIILVVGILTAAVATARTAPEGTPADASGPYLGQERPGGEPAIFAPGVVNTGLYTRDLTISPAGDELYFGVRVGGYAYATILRTVRTNGTWTVPEVPEFAADARFKSIEPHIAPDGGRLFFVSDRPDASSGREGNEDIWVMDRSGDGWGEPYNLGSPVNSDLAEYFPTVTHDGTLYFTRENPDDGTGGIYRSRLVDGGYTEPELLPEQVNAGAARFNAFVAPDESYVIVPIHGLEDSRGGVDYYVTFRDEDDRWTGPFNLGPAINTDGSQEYSASVSPDGKFLFFMSARTVPGPELLTREGLRRLHNEPGHGLPAIWWVEASVIEVLRP